MYNELGSDTFQQLLLIFFVGSEMPKVIESLVLATRWSGFAGCGGIKHFKSEN